MPESIIHRIKPALHLLLRGEKGGPSHTTAGTRTVPALTLEEASEARQFFPLPKFFIFGHARSGTTLLTRLVRLHPRCTATTRRTSLPANRCWKAW